jgi:NAD+ synthase (glutamine-hydrolysing)
MLKIFRGNAEHVKADLASEGIKYGISIGRRAPMHRMHVDCIKEIADAGLTPVIFIGSTNKPDSRYYDPLRNPLTVEQQKEQLKRAVPQYYDEARIVTLPDVGDPEKWFDGFLSSLEKTDFAGKSAVHYRTRPTDGEHQKEAIRPLSAYAKGFGERGIPAWESHNRNPADEAMNATEMRSWDLEHLTAEQRTILSTPDYLIDLARDARNSNPDKALLEQHHIPLTTLDLTFDRLRKEARISTASLVEAAQQTGAVDTVSLAGAVNAALRKKEPASDKDKPFQIKIASASCNQTGGDWPRNLKNICTAIDKAVADSADILSLEELGITGYERGDDFYYSDNMKTREMLQLIADYAASKDPNLVISVGHPWYFADKSIPDQDERRKNPIYNRINNNFNVQSILSHGEIVSMSNKAWLFNYERGYEKRHFEEWSDEHANRYQNEHGKGRHGTIMIELPEMHYDNGVKLPKKVIPFGSPIVQLSGEDGGRDKDKESSSKRKVNLFHIICEGYWVGSRFDGSPDNSNYDRDNQLARKARDFDITVALNPNASPPAANKIDKHYELSKLASRHCGVLVHTDGLGSSGSTFAQFGSRLMAQDGKIISEGVRNSFKDVAYTSQVVTVTSAIDKGNEPHVVIPHCFKKKYIAPVQDGPAPWENNGRREFEEEMRNELLWLFDYLRKNKLQGFAEALSGGADSGYNSAKVRLMVELGVKELGVEGFMQALPHLKYKQAVLDAYHKQGEKAVIKTIMDHMLTCVYMGTDNSSEDTLRAAKTLIEGGTREDGSHFDGIGGKFHYRNIQRLVEIYAEIFSGVNPSMLDDARDIQIRKEIAAILGTRKEDTTHQELAQRVERFKTLFEEVSHDVLSVANEDHITSYENLQARLRQVLLHIFSNMENKVSIANPNLDEGRNSYATWGGDLHGGMISGNAHKNKQRQLDHMRLLEEHGLEGITPVKALYWTLKNKPSAELQPRSKDGKVTQFDEEQLGRSFVQMEAISDYMLYDRPLSQQERKNNPIEVFEKCRQHPAFADDTIEKLHDRIRVSYQLWAHAQFKAHGSPLAATYGRNIDHQSSLRTPNIASYHRPELAQLALHALNEMAKRDGSSFEALSGGQSIKTLSKRALLDEDFANALTAGMWTPEVKVGSKLRVGTLYRHIKEHGFDSLSAPSPMSHIISEAARYRTGTQPSAER